MNTGTKWINSFAKLVRYEEGDYGFKKIIWHSPNTVFGTMWKYIPENTEMPISHTVHRIPWIQSTGQYVQYRWKII